MTRKTIAILVLAGGMLGAFFITHLAAPSDSGLATLSISATGGNDPSFAFSNGTAYGDDTARNREGNVTEEVVRRYGKEVLKLNPRGAGTTGIYVPNQATLDALIQTEITREFTFERVFTARDFQTVPNNAVGTIQGYLEGISKVPEGSADLEFLPSVAAAVAHADAEPLEQYVRASNDYLDNLFVVTVPSDWILFHIKMANIWQARVELARAILTMEEDPLRAIAALNAVPKTAEEERELLTLLKELLAKAS